MQQLRTASTCSANLHRFVNMIYDVIIIGAGLSGASAAISLAKRGLQVLAIEAGEFPRHKVCGEFLSPESKAVLQRLGVLQALLDAGAQSIDAARIVAPNGRAIRTSIPGGALSISRWQLDAILAAAIVENGGILQTQTRVKSIERDSEEFLVHTSQQTLRARRVIAAPGRNSHALQRAKDENLTKYVGLKTHLWNAEVSPHLVELHTWRGGYCGLSRIEGGRVNACLLARYDFIEGRAPAEVWRDLLKDLPFLKLRVRAAEIALPWLATANITFAPPQPLAKAAASTCSDNGAILCAGDAAGFIHPLTGDGMAMALHGGELAAATIASSLRGELDVRAMAMVYNAAWQREFGPRMQWASRLQSILIEPERLAPALALASHWPRLAQWAVARTRGV